MTSEPIRHLASWTAGALALALATGPVLAQDGAQEAGTFDCLIQPMMVVKLGTPTPGLISEVLVDRGSLVHKGDVIARLQSGVEEASFALAKARAENESTVRSNRAKLDFQRRKADRLAQLRRNDNVAFSASDEAETSARVAEQDLREAELNQIVARLEMTRAAEQLKQRLILSPLDGIVTERSLGPGEYAYDQSHVATLAQIDPLKVEVYLPLSQYRKVRPGMVAEVMPENPVGGSYPGKVTVVDQVFDAASGTIGVRIELPNPDRALPSGIKCQVRFPGTG